ncbi:probable transporter Seo1p [[Candida] railenensis]|uniref:Probable transporter Seo1p n=1 Tax=[Candida] railenensis TaxID=45579 RepID=A0A9P0QU54_9ASCO|nr:probable transporter Seo1p [[Candida] railenensis]
MSTLKNLKWGFLPTRRIVDEFPIIDPIVQVHATKSNDSTEKDDTKALEKSDKESSKDEVESSDEVLEYRDEKNRPWWKFFDEYEYRITKKSKNKQKWFKWFHEDDTPEERRLILKLDIILAFYSLAAYWVKYLDQTNLNNAYTAGLQEGIGMKGNDLVNTQVLFTVGNIVFQLPFMYLLWGAPLNYILPSLDIIWSIITICVSQVNTVPQLKALRFLIGCLESPSYFSYQFLFGSWYKSYECSRRSMIFYLGQYLGLLTSSLLSGSIVAHLKSGMAPWRWIFIIDGIISIVVGIIGFYAIPGTPKDCYSIFLSDDEIRLARKRLETNETGSRPDTGTGPNANPLYNSFLDLQLWKQILTSWEIYVLILFNVFCWNNNNGTSGAYLLWLKAEGFGPARRQDLGALTPGLGLLWLFLTCTYADLFKSRWSAIIISQLFNITGNVLLAVWDVPKGAKWFAWCLQYFGWAMAPVLYSWQNDICRKDVRKRSVILVVMNILAQTSTAFISVLVWKTVEAPEYFKGFTFTASSALALSVWTFVVLWYYKRDEKKSASERGIIIYDSSVEELDPSKKNAVDSKQEVEDI